MRKRLPFLLSAVVVLASTRASADPPADAVQDVVVRGGKGGPAAADSVGPTEVRTMPGAFGDPFRAIDTTPGFTPVLSGLPYFYVRGAPPGNVGYMFDGVRVPYLFHFGLGPGVIHPELVLKTTVHKGGYPARLGRFAGGIVESTARRPLDRVHGVGQIRAIDAGALIEAPFANGRGSALAAARYSYTAALFSLLQSDTLLDYRDYQARVTYALTDVDEISLLTFGAYDLAAQRTTVDPTARQRVGLGGPSRPIEIERILFASEFHRADVRWDRELGLGGHLRLALTAGYDRTRMEARRSAEDFLTAARVEFEQPVSDAVRLRAGANVNVDRYRADALPRYADDDDVVDRESHLFVTRTDVTTSLHADAVIVPSPGAEIVPGARLDSYRSGNVHAFSFDPRLATRFAVGDRVRIIHALGLATQAPSPPLSLPAISIGRLYGGLQRSFQTSAGIEVDVPLDFTGGVTAFHNAFFDLNDALGAASIEIVDIERTDALLNKARGSAFGLEVSLKRKVTKRLTGGIDYTLSRSMRTIDGRHVLSAYDRTHVANAMLSYDLGRGFRAGARYVVYSGVPARPADPAFPGQVVATPPSRTPVFHRIDVRLEKRWSLGRTGWISVILEGLNATLSREVTGYDCPTSFSSPGSTASFQCRERIVGPIAVPSVGIEGGF